MLAQALAALALAATPGEGEYVRSVRVVAPDEARLTAFVGLVPGRPLDPEAVRRAGELIFATGASRTCVWNCAARASRIDVVFRPIPAPLLVAVGSRRPVLSPRDRAHGAAAARRAALARAPRAAATWF
jgi:hypothetical protein